MLSQAFLFLFSTQVPIGTLGLHDPHKYRKGIGDGNKSAGYYTCKLVVNQKFTRGITWKHNDIGRGNYVEMCLFINAVTSMGHKIQTKIYHWQRIFTFQNQQCTSTKVFPALNTQLQLLYALIHQSSSLNMYFLYSNKCYSFNIYRYYCQSNVCFWNKDTVCIVRLNLSM